MKKQKNENPKCTDYDDEGRCNQCGQFDCYECDWDGTMSSKDKDDEDEEVKDDKPVIEINKGPINAHYYDDFSGEISIEDKDGEEIFFKEDGKLKHHIEYLNEAIEDIKKKYNNHLKLYKKAISLLEKEQNKQNVKK